MKLLNLMHNDTVWVYNITDNVYTELRVVEHSHSTNITQLERTGQEKKHLPLSARFAPAVKLVREVDAANNCDKYHTIQRNNILDRFRDFRTVISAKIICKVIDWLGYTSC